MNKMKILPFDIYFIICMNYQHNLLMPDYRQKIVAAIYANGDFDFIEMCEIMLMPVIQPTKTKNQKIFMLLNFNVLEMVDLRLKFIVKL